MRLFITYCFILSAILLTGCATTKYLSIVDGSKADGTLTMVYQYGIFEDPEVDWNHAKSSAIKKCRSWGYQNAEFFGSGFQECISVNGYGDCIKWRVTYKCQCTNE